MERKTRQLSRGYAALFASIAIWSMPSLFQFYLVRYYEPFAQNFYRYSVACLAITPFVFYRVRRGGPKIDLHALGLCLFRVFPMSSIKSHRSFRSSIWDPACTRFSIAHP